MKTQNRFTKQNNDPLGSWSASTSPARSPSPARYGAHSGGHHHHRSSRRCHLQYPQYGTTSLCQRSRSPSPARLQELREKNRLADDEMGTEKKKKIKNKILKNNYIFKKKKIQYKEFVLFFKLFYFSL